MAILMLYKNTKAMVCSSDGDIDFLDIVAGVLQGVTLAPYMFIICQDYILRTSIDLIKENGSTFKKTRSRYIYVYIHNVDIMFVFISTIPREQIKIC